MHFCEGWKSLGDFLTIGQEIHCLLWNLFANQNVNAEICGFGLEIFFDQFKRLLAYEVNPQCVWLWFLDDWYFSDVFDTLIQ